VSKTSSIVKRLWTSPSLTTWGSLTVRSLNVAIILPFAFRLFSPEEFVIWQALATIISTQLLFDVGLTPTFSRLIAFAMGGATRFDDFRAVASAPPEESAEPNWPALGKIWSTLLWLYRRLIVVVFLGLAIFGTLSLVKPLSEIPNPTTGWLAWAVVLVTAPLGFSSLPYAAYLLGGNQIALLRRWETLVACGAVLSNLLTLALGGGLLALVISSQVWSLINAWQIRRLARTVFDEKMKTFPAGQFAPDIFQAAWPAAWRSGVGVILTAGVVHLTALWYAQLGSPLEVAAYFLALRLITAISHFSQAPFYSKLPVLAKLQAQGKTEDLVRFARRGMRFALWVYVVGASVVAFGLEPALQFLGKSTVPLDPLLWWLLAAAFLAERFGSMHLQLYSVTNHIIWHKVSAISGTLILVTGLLTYPFLGIYAFPISFLVGYFGFFSWYCARKVYSTFGVPWLRFERTVGLAAAVGFVLAVGLQTWLGPITAP
jgi:hypothetical protein